jgi:nucleotidyltransferase/DNA polymerase involved in DNA repair
LREQTRQYLIEARGRRLGTYVEPAPAPEPEPVALAVEPPVSLGILPDPHLAALAPAAQAPLPPAPSAPLPAQAKALPLTTLRLLGQGMIWRLNNMGLHTLDDLAACDSARLSDGLGPIGRLVRTEVWIEAAREILSQE